jgi:hypothetical protein
LVGLTGALLAGLLFAWADHPLDASPLPGGNEPEVLISATLEPPANNPDRLLLRPNVIQGFYLFVKNPTKNNKMFTVKVTAGQKTFDPIQVAVDAGKTKPVLFNKPPEKVEKPPAGTPAPAAKPDEGVGLPGPPFKFEVALFDGANAVGEPKSVEILLQTPDKYLNDNPTASYEASNNRARNLWEVILEAKPEAFPGPDCPVKLDFRPDRIPGLKSAKPRKDSVLGTALTKETTRVRLFATDLDFDNTVAAEDGFVYVTVDKYPRAFIYKTAFVRDGKRDPELVKAPNLRVVAEPYVNPDKGKITIAAEVDNVPLEDAADPVTVELGIDLDLSGNYSAGQKFKVPKPGPRQQSVRLSPGSPTGALVVETKVEDWSHDWDVKDVLGKRTLRARLLDATGKERLKDTRTVTFLTTGPQDINFGKLPASFKLDGKPLVVTATTSDPPDQIKSVVFFLGKPPVDGKLLPTLETVPGVLQEDDNKTTWWTANLPIAPDSRSPVQVSVQFVNKVDLPTFKTALVKVVAEKAAAPATVGKIIGTVEDGGARSQPDLNVVLKDAKGMAVTTVKTNADGQFEFKDVPPGQYHVFSNSTFPARKGENAVEVKAGQTTKTTITLGM